MDAAGTVYVADGGPYQTFNNTIRKISVDGVVSTLAGKVGVDTPVDGVGVTASFATPEASPSTTPEPYSSPIRGPTRSDKSRPRGR